MKHLVPNTIMNQMSVIWWILSSVCLPVSLPYVIYKIILKVQNRSLRTTLRDKVVLITGASSGLGEALAHAFYACGCRVVLAARRTEELKRVKEELLRLHPTVPTHPPIVLQMDLGDLNSLPSVIDKVYEILGELDVLINNAGMSYRGAVMNTKMEVDIKLMLVNYFGQVALTKSVLPKMLSKGSGHIVFVSSIQGRVSIPHRSAYSASKHALQAFADSLRAEVSERNISVSVVSPGYIKTSLSINALTGDGDKHGKMDKSTASGYTAEFVAEEIVSVVARKKNESIISPVIPKIAVFLRYMLPSLYFWIMKKRAKMQN